jgi:phage terminase large subunit
MVAHRRAGKTVAAIADLVIAAGFCRKPDGRFAFIAPLFNQAKDVAWPYLLRLTADLKPQINESELRVDLPNGARVRLYGADNYERLRGGYFDGLVLDEFGDMDPRAWQEVLRPALTDRRGWAVFIGTPKGRNEFCAIWEKSANDKDWFRYMLKASESTILPLDELEDSRRSMSEDQYAQEYECSFAAAVVGSYYGKLLADLEDKKRIASLSWDPALPVTTAWDLGIGDRTSIWFAQQVANEIRLIDYHEATGEGMAYFARMLAAKPYLYKEHIVPHDADARLQDELGRTRREILEGLGVKTRPLKPNHPPDGIEAVRVMLPRCWFDRSRCEHGLEALKQYRKDWDEKLKTFRDKAKHDWTSHAADAFRYLAVGLQEIREKRKVHAYAGGSWMG